MKSAFGKIFTDSNGSEYGVIRQAEAPFPTELTSSEVLAEDGCGNYFIVSSNSICFWDHETANAKPLTGSLSEFIAGCSVPVEVELKQEQVESVWVDPEFAKQFGIKPKL